jgi:hypothetical protein
MAEFTTRVLLSGNPPAEVYDKLHKAMKKKGFSRVIKGDNGAYFWLPHAEYNRSTSVSRSQVLTDAQAAADTVSTSNEILVTESNGRAGNGLKTATSADAAAA